MRARILILSAALGVVGACSDVDTEVSAPATGEAAEPGRPAIYAAAAEGPEAFVRALYAVHVAGGPRGEQPPPGRDPIYSRMLNAMIGGDVNAANGEVPYLNYDPICACQDNGDFTLDSVTMTRNEPRAAEAAVVFTNMGETKRQTLKLVKEGPMWRVEDIIDAEGQALSVPLLAAIEAGEG